MTMTVKERLHRAIDELPDAHLAPEVLRSRAPESLRHLAEAIDELAVELRDMGAQVPPETVRGLADAVRNLAGAIRRTDVLDAIDRPTTKPMADHGRPQDGGQAEDGTLQRSADARQRVVGLLGQAMARWDDALAHLLSLEGGTLTAPEVAKRLQVSAPAVHSWTEQRRLLAIQSPDGSVVYPVWQFTHKGVLPGLQTVLVAHRASGPEVAIWFLSPDPRFDGRRPLDILREGGRVRTLARAAAAYGEQGAA